MSGGVAYVLDQDGTFPNRLNRELVRADRVTEADEVKALRTLVERHQELTGSERARGLLEGWSEQLAMFWRVAPKAAPTGDAVTPSETRATGEADTAVGLPQGG
jgi:glutamate synthase (ferredoxin)